jgi:hypothetical protein
MNESELRRFQYILDRVNAATIIPPAVFLWSVAVFGHTIDVLFRAFPVYDEGRLTGWECFIHDQKHSIPNIVRSLSRLEMKQEQFAELLETHTYISSAAHKNIQSRLKDYEARMEKAERQQRLHNTWIEGERAKS